jgi:hypothetical protein
MLKQALKEWAVICRALAEGRQTLLLRKGGLTDQGPEFELEHQLFWLYPTYLHEHREGIKAEGYPLLASVEVEKPPQGSVRLSHFAEVTGLYQVHDLDLVERLDPLHLWSEKTVHARFGYRRPGLFVLPVRVWQAGETFELPEIPAYAGCKSWVELERELPTEGATPVLEQEEYRDVVRLLDLLLQPTLFA